MFHVDGRPVHEKPLVEPTLPFIFEEWKNKIFDPVTWAEFSTDANSYRTLETDAARGSNVIRLTSNVFSSVQYLFGQMNWQARSGSAIGELSGYDNTAALRYLVLEFEAKLHNHEHMDNASVFMGFTPNPTLSSMIRGDVDIIGFALSPPLHHDLITLTDLNGSETAMAVAGPPAIDDQLHHYRIWLFDNKVVFMFDHSIINVHDTDLSNNAVYPFWGVGTNPLDEPVWIDVTNITVGYRRYPTQIHKEVIAPI